MGLDFVCWKFLKSQFQFQYLWLICPYFLVKKLFIYFLDVFIAACGLSLVAVHRLLIAAASLVAELRLYSLQAMVVAATGL